jgi:hypothetical protein
MKTLGKTQFRMKVFPTIHHPWYIDEGHERIQPFFDELVGPQWIPGGTHSPTLFARDLWSP